MWLEATARESIVVDSNFGEWFDPPFPHLAGVFNSATIDGVFEVQTIYTHATAEVKSLCRLGRKNNLDIFVACWTTLLAGMGFRVKQERSKKKKLMAVACGAPLVSLKQMIHAITWNGAYARRAGLPHACFSPRLFFPACHQCFTGKKQKVSQLAT